MEEDDKLGQGRLSDCEYGNDCGYVYYTLICTAQYQAMGNPRV